ncbi:TonB-dependent receptor [Sphingosinicella rhizophila]|uniref:TonB-dependent receptor n=1 Tax=Sphingosinicella rhizophila TaxID=3050082 RepID=A0ABU3QAT0_9SPHN|nr:TonB-dependent receptor [Sphingosinicella sp. GR2756]MDT9600516.1 TonB-dependent receptor [Sphingosinicella sp. GR2756]
MSVKYKQLSSAAVAAAILAGIMHPGAALAQSGAEAPEEGEIVVTATRREESVLDVPLSITALSGDKLVAEGKDDLADYIRQVPGVTFRQQSPGLNEISIRGVSGGGGQRAKAPISFYIDDVPVISDPGASPDVKTFDIERVEILRGPQGTLFGESAIGGVIRIISKRPDPNKFEARVRGSYLNFAHGEGGYNADVMLNIPVVNDKFAIRGTLSRRDEGGWIDNLSPAFGGQNINDLDFWSGRVTALWTPTPDLEISATGFFTRSEYGGRQFANRDYEQTINVDEARRDNIDQFNFTVKYDFDFAELVSSTNYFKRTTSRLFDLFSFNGFLPGLIDAEGGLPPGTVFDTFYQTLDIDDKSFVQEIRLISPGDSAFRWVAGLYYFDTKNNVGVDFMEIPSIPFNPLRLRRVEDYQQYAAFGQVEYDVSSRVTLITGLRYTKEDRKINYDQSDDFTSLTGFRFLPAIGIFDVDLGYDILTPKFAIQFKPSDQAQIYVSATNGFRGPGGNTDFNDNGVRQNVYGAEKIWSYELGAKGRFFDALTMEAAAFYTDWKDRQEVVNPGAPFNEQYVSNIGSAEIYGFEASLSYAFRYVTVGGNISYTHTEIVESGQTAFVGLPLTAQPEWRGSAYFDARFPLGNRFYLKAHGDISFEGDKIFSYTTPVKEGSYKLVNAIIGIARDNWSVDLFVRNLTDEFIAYGAGVNVSVNEPRVIGLAFDVSF